MTEGDVFDMAAVPGTCTPDDSAEDAFFQFTLASSTEVYLSTEETGGAHVLSLFDRDPRFPNKPATSGASFSSNVNSGAYTYPTAWTTCAASGTTTINTTTGVITTSCTAAATSTYTNNNVAQAAGGPNVFVIRLSSMAIPATHTVTITGDKPAIFLVSGTVAVDGTIKADAAGTTAGAGGNYASCTGGTGANGSSLDGAGGGGGGGFGQAGAAGAAGRGVGNQGAGGSAGAAVGSASTLMPLRGGCKGGQGGQQSGPGGAGGGGGGAFQVSAGATFTIGSGAILSASGGGGALAPGDDEGGGGGGSGGAVLLEASGFAGTSPATRTFVNGGGGGGGGGDFSGGDSSGTDGWNVSPRTNRAPGGVGGGGGSGTGDGGNGGQGGAPSGSATTGAANCCAGGGGGGGGLGFIVARVITSNPAFEYDTQASATAGGVPYAVADNSWTVKTANMSTKNAEWAVLDAKVETRIPRRWRDRRRPDRPRQRRHELDRGQAGHNRR